MITSCLADLPPLTIEIERSSDGLWTMRLFDHRSGARVTMPPSEFALGDAKQKAVFSAQFYMRKHGGDPAWEPPASIEWQDFTPREIIWET
jgi:hypothetical protein